MSSTPTPLDPKTNPTGKSPFLLVLTSHWVSMVGVILILTALCTWLFLLPLQMRGHTDNPYLGILAFVIVPIVLFAGIGLTLVGMWLGRRRMQRRMAQVVDRKAATSRLMLTLGAAAVVNLAVGTQVTYRAVQHMETPQFCGSCHVMAPEDATHADSPHAQVSCAECHIGDGASGWVKSKINGARQFFENLSDSFPKPIPSALSTDSLVPAKQTCEECHWRGKPGGFHVRVLNSFGEDEANTLSQTVLSVQVGGTVLGGIHGRHLNPDLEIRFASTDPMRQDVVWVESRNAKTGEVKTFTKGGAKPEQFDSLKRITMECVDCHNRVGHAQQLPARAIDTAMANGKLPTTLPFLKKISLGLLKAEYPSQEEAGRKIQAGLLEAYSKDHAEVFAARKSEIEAAGQVLTAIYDRNVFPELKVTWNTYPDNIGHTDSLGCFRCHDGDHTTADSKQIPNNCFVCHFSAAVDETEPEVLQTLGIDKVLARARKK